MQNIEFSSCGELSEDISRLYPHIQDPFDPHFTKEEENAWAKRLHPQVNSPLKEQLFYVFAPWEDYNLCRLAHNARTLLHTEGYTPPNAH